MHLTPFRSLIAMVADASNRIYLFSWNIRGLYSISQRVLIIPHIMQWKQKRKIKFKIVV